MRDFRYEIQTGKVAHEVIDGEVIVLQFDTGFYFSITSDGAPVWSWLEQGATHQQIIDAFEPLRDDQLTRLCGFLDALEAERIILKTEVDGPVQRPAHLPAHKVPFPSLTLERYGDMQDLLKADPIHEVDETGWPAVQPKE